MTKAKLPFLDKEACEGAIHRPDCLINRGGCWRPCLLWMSILDRDPTGSLGPSRRKSTTEWPTEASDPRPPGRLVLKKEPREAHTRAERKIKERRVSRECVLTAVIFSSQRPAKKDKTMIAMSRLVEKGKPAQTSNSTTTISEQAVLTGRNLREELPRPG